MTTNTYPLPPALERTPSVLSESIDQDVRIGNVLALDSVGAIRRSPFFSSFQGFPLGMSCTYGSGHLLFFLVPNSSLVKEGGCSPTKGGYEGGPW